MGASKCFELPRIQAKFFLGFKFQSNFLGLIFFKKAWILVEFWIQILAFMALHI